MNQYSFKSILIGFAAILFIVACKKAPVEELSIQPPQQQLPNPLPAHALVKLIKWSETDHETFSYNARGQVSQLRSQWQYVEGDPTQIKTITYDFQYDELDRPIGVNSTGDHTVRYIYHGNLIHRTQELNPNNTVAKEVTYIYSGNRVIQENWLVNNVSGEPPSVYKHVFFYDLKGNMNKVEIFQQTEDLQYKLLETIEYSDFDNMVNTTSWMLRFPFLPQLRLQYNNPRKELRRPAGEGQAETTTYSYVYNGLGLPITKRTTYASGIVLTATYQY